MLLSRLTIMINVTYVHCLFYRFDRYVHYPKLPVQLDIRL